MGMRIKKNLIRSQCSGNVGKTKLKIHVFAGRQRIGQLIFMEINQ